MDADLDIFALGRHALATTRAAFAGRAFLTSARRLSPRGSMQGPRESVLTLVEETDLASLGGLKAAKQAGADALLATLGGTEAKSAIDLGMRVLVRVPFAAGEAEVERSGRLDLLRASLEAVPAIDGVVPSPLGEAQGLDTLAFFAACRGACQNRHVVADLELLGPKLGQLCLSFGADEVLGAIAKERALRLGENASSKVVTHDEAALLVRASGFVPCERLPEGKVREL